MTLRIANLRAELAPDPLPLEKLVCSALGIRPGSIRKTRLIRKSVDARNKADVHFVITVEFQTDLNPAKLHAPRGCTIEEYKEVSYTIPEISPTAPKHCVVVGLGPAGLFGALLLARAGLTPLVLERGAPVDERRQAVDTFWAGGPLDEDSNVQFGEGGAGAFSDGKLNSGITDPRCRFVLETLYEHGAPEEILYDAKPHIGTDRLPGVVQSIREEILSLGGNVLFHTRLNELIVENGRIIGVIAGGQEYPADAVLLAIGHSARDTFHMLQAKNVPMIPKAFSVGARIEHPQSMVNASQYGRFAENPALGAADYKLSWHTKSGRGVYTFCMCPGGQVVAATSEKERVVTNGMSPFARDGQNANSALLVSVEPADYGYIGQSEDGIGSGSGSGIETGNGSGTGTGNRTGTSDVLAGVHFQQELEHRAFLAGNSSYCAPCQKVGDFLKGKPSKAPGSVEPTYRPGVVYTSLDACLPEFALDAMREALPVLGRRLHGFDAPEALLTGVETRSSSPVRILRGRDCQSEIHGLYPSGEGAGYAGGILSAAVDGLKCAESILHGSLTTD